MDSELEIGDWIVAKALKDPKVQQIVANAHLFDDMKKSPAWQKLYELTKKKKQTFLERISQRLWDDQLLIPSREEIQYHKGFYQGCIWVLAHPEHAAINLERAARTAWLLSHDDIDQAEQEETA